MLTLLWVFVKAEFSLRSITVLMALLLVGCARKEAAESAGAGSPPPAQAPTAEATKKDPAATMTERMAREKFTGDLDTMIKRRVIRILVVADRNQETQGLQIDVSHGGE